MTPDFLIVGAMKAGTTSLFRDLAKHPDVFVPGNKEPETLVRLQDHGEIMREYATLFAGARPGQKLGEASTAYTKRPTFTDAATRAAQVCGPELKIIYMRRDPVDRIVSQYHHECEHGTITEPFGAAIRRHPRLIDYSRYVWQIEPWRQTFGDDAVLEIDLADYGTDRVRWVKQAVRHIGLDPERLASFDVTQRANRADEAKTIENPLLARMVYSNLYQNRIKRLFSDDLRAKVRNAILPRPVINAVTVNEDDRAFIAKRLREPTGETAL